MTNQLAALEQARSTLIDLSIKFGPKVAYATDLNRALAAVNDVLQASPLVLKEPVALVGINALADSSIDIAINPWVNVPDYGAARAAVNKGIVEKFRETQIEIPLPQREIRLLGGSPA